MEEKILEAASYVKNIGVAECTVGIILGTGLGNLVQSISVEKEIPYSEIPHFPEATVEFHSGKLIYGTLQGVKVLAMQGRFHFYEGYDFKQIAFPVCVMHACGIKSLLISNAAGAINLNFKKGDLMLITDHINTFPGNPLIGPNMDELGTRFPDMSQPYSNELCNKLRLIAKNQQISLKEGVYIAAQGPMLETPAEYRYLRLVGGDAVGMSTIPEVIAANHLGLPCCAVSVLTDECDPDNLQPINIEEIIAVAGKAELKLTSLFTELVSNLN